MLDKNGDRHGRLQSSRRFDHNVRINSPSETPEHNERFAYFNDRGARIFNTILSVPGGKDIYLSHVDRMQNADRDTIRQSFEKLYKSSNIVSSFDGAVKVNLVDSGHLNEANAPKHVLDKLSSDLEINLDRSKLTDREQIEKIIIDGFRHASARNEFFSRSSRGEGTIIAAASVPLASSTFADRSAASSRPSSGSDASRTSRTTTADAIAIGSRRGSKSSTIATSISTATETHASSTPELIHVYLDRNEMPIGSLSDRTLHASATESIPIGFSPSRSSLGSPTRDHVAGMDLQRNIPDADIQVAQFGRVGRARLVDVPKRLSWGQSALKAIQAVYDRFSDTGDSSRMGASRTRDLSARPASSATPRDTIPEGVSSSRDLAAARPDRSPNYCGSVEKLAERSRPSGVEPMKRIDRVNTNRAGLDFRLRSDERGR